jgi:hypothetical protein
MLSMLKWWREYTIAGLLAVVVGGYKLWPEAAPCDTQVQVVKEKEQLKQTVTTVTKKPDGTVEEKTVQTEKDTKVSSQTADKKSMYGVGVYVNTADRADYRIDASVRLGTLPVHAVAGYEFKDKTIYTGVRLEF